MFNTSFENSKRALFREQKEDKHPTDELLDDIFDKKLTKLLDIVQKRQLRLREECGMSKPPQELSNEDSLLVFTIFQTSTSSRKPASMQPRTDRSKTEIEKRLSR